MPYSTEWVDPGVFFKHQGATIYCTYKNDDIQQGANTYRFSLNELCGEQSCTCDNGECRYVFDVRTLPTWTEPPHPAFLTRDHDTPENKKAWQKYHEEQVEEKHIQNVIRESLDRGLLVPPPSQEVEGREPSSSFVLDQALLFGLAALGDQDAILELGHFGEATHREALQRLAEARKSLKADLG